MRAGSRLAEACECKPPRTQSVLMIPMSGQGADIDFPYLLHRLSTPFPLLSLLPLFSIARLAVIILLDTQAERSVPRLANASPRTRMRP